jgi:hypothetical protein
MFTNIHDHRTNMSRKFTYTWSLRCFFFASIKWRHNSTRPITGWRQKSIPPCLGTRAYWCEWVFLTCTFFDMTIIRINYCTHKTLRATLCTQTEVPLIVFWVIETLHTWNDLTTVILLTPHPDGTLVRTLTKTAIIRQKMTKFLWAKMTQKICLEKSG